MGKNCGCNHSSSSSSSGSSSSSSSSCNTCECKKVVKCKPADAAIAKTIAIQESINIINTMISAFSAAVRAQDPIEKAALVHKLEKYFTKHFEIIVTFGNVVLTANDFNTLLILIQGLSQNVTYDASLIGNHSVLKYKQKENCKRIVKMAALEYITQTNTNGISSLLTGLDKFIIVETECDKFKISK